MDKNKEKNEQMSFVEDLALEKPDEVGLEAKYGFDVPWYGEINDEAETEEDNNSYQITDEEIEALEQKYEETISAEALLAQAETQEKGVKFESKNLSADAATQLESVEPKAEPADETAKPKFKKKKIPPVKYYPQTKMQELGLLLNPRYKYCPPLPDKDGKVVDRKIYNSKQLRLALKMKKREDDRLRRESKTAIDNAIAIAKGIAPKNKVFEDIREVVDPAFVRYDAKELVVITKTKQLVAYLFVATHKAPKSFRYSFINRIHNLGLDILEDMFYANSLRKDNVRTANKRLEKQHDAYTKLKLLDYFSFLAFENKCLLMRQYKQIAIQISNCIALLLAWTKK